MLSTAQLIRTLSCISTLLPTVRNCSNIFDADALSAGETVQDPWVLIDNREELYDGEYPMVTQHVSTILQLALMCLKMHPVLDVPFFQLHPCRTADLMKATRPHDHVTASAYVLRWLSLVGPTIGLRLPDTVFQLVIES